MDVETMRYYFTNGLWTLGRLDRLLAAGNITQEQYNYVTEEKEMS